MKKENLERLEHSTIDNIRLFYSCYFIVDGDDFWDNYQNTPTKRFVF
jgi:hypothetical protein